MNIWLINHYAVPPKYYPLARPTLFAKNLMAMGHTVTVFAASSVHNSDVNLITDGRKWRAETVDGVHYVYIKCCDYQGSGLKRIYNICEFAWKLPGVCKQFPKPDAIVATSVPPTSCAMGVRMGRKWDCKTVAEIADLWPESIVSFGIAGPHNPAVIALRRLEKWIYKNAGAVVFTMEGAYDYIVEQGWENEIPRSKVYHINNGVDLEQFDYNTEHFRVDDPDLDDPDTFKVVYTGSIRLVNNLGLLLDVAGHLKERRVKFLIWGSGDEREALEQRVRGEGLSNVVFKGRVEKKYVPAIVSRADLNVMDMQEKNELFRFGISPNKLFEYFAAERPVLMYQLDRYNPAMEYRAGFVAQNKDELVSCIETLAGGQQWEAGWTPACSRKAAEAFSYQTLTAELIKILEEDQ